MGKKEVILLLVILLSFLFITDLIRNLTINAFIFRNVDTKATSEAVSVSILVAEAPAEEAIIGAPSHAKPILIPIYKPGKLFNISINIPEKYRTLIQGEKLPAEITITNIQKIGLVDVLVNYLIKDSDNKIIRKEFETKAVENIINYIKETDTSNIEPGNYIFITEVRYNDDLATDSDLFTILEKPHIEKPVILEKASYPLTAIILVITTISVILIYIYLKIKIKKLKKKKITKRKKRWLC